MGVSESALCGSFNDVDFAAAACLKIMFLSCTECQLPILRENERFKTWIIIILISRSGTRLDRP